MLPTNTRHANRNFTPPESWDQSKDGPCGDLPVRMQMHGSRGIFELVSTWKPDAEELAHLNRGGVIELAVCSTNQPPVGLSVVDPVGTVIVEDRHGKVPTLTINEGAHGDSVGTYDEHGPATP